MDGKNTPALIKNEFTQNLRDNLILLHQHAGNPDMNRKWTIDCETRDKSGNHASTYTSPFFDGYTLRVRREPLAHPVISPQTIWIQNEREFFDSMDTPEETRAILNQIPTRHAYLFIIEQDDQGEYELISNQHDWYSPDAYSSRASLQLKESNFDFSEAWFRNMWVSESHILGECTRVFLRLTAQPDGSLVDLWDLIDDRPLEKKYTAYLIIREIFAWTCKQATPPVQYDATTGVFTKTSESFERIKGFIKDLDNQFKTWGTSEKT